MSGPTHPPTYPLAGVTVIDLTQIYNGPYATFLMAMAGADVIKIEPPAGEHLRKRQGQSGAALPFAMLNANKRSLRLDLKQGRGRALLLDLVRGADVLVENFAPGVLERLGLGWDALRAANPRLIYAQSSGYGSSGPYRDYPAMDLAVQAMAGIIASTGYPDQPPVKAGPAMCDFFTGVHLYGAIVTALYERTRTGEGRAVEVSMMESVYTSLSSNLGMFYGSGGTRATRTGNRHGGLTLAPYSVYPTRDGYVAIITNNETHWQALLRALDKEAVGRDPRFATLKDRIANMDALDAMVADWTRDRGKQEICDLLLPHRVPCAPVRELPEVVADPHLHARGMLQEIDHPEYGRITVPGSPLRFHGLEPMPHQPSRPLGADGDAVLERLGLDAEAIAALRRDGVI